MIYLPSHFEAKDARQAHDLIRANPFATLIAHHQSEILINHLPILFDSGRLVGHMATRNPQSSIPNGAGVTVVFHGPHTYVTPKWYAENDVPTWNYAVVHATGKIRWVREARPLIEILRRMTDFFEAGEREPWRFFLPDDLRKPEDLTSAIVGFEIEIERFDAKFKLSQNRSEEDQRSVIRGLRDRKDEMSRRIAELMEINK